MQRCLLRTPATGEPEVQAAFQKAVARRAAQCALPDGVYRARRGFNMAKPPQCLTNYHVGDVTIRAGRIEFRSEGRMWTGTVDQAAGTINIQWRGIIADTEAAPRQNTYIVGDYRNAEMFSAACGRGIFAIQK